MVHLCAWDETCISTMIAPLGVPVSQTVIPQWLCNQPDLHWICIQLLSALGCICVYCNLIRRRKCTNIATEQMDWQVDQYVDTKWPEYIFWNMKMWCLFQRQRKVWVTFITLAHSMHKRYRKEKKVWTHLWPWGTPCAMCIEWFGLLKFSQGREL